LVNLRKCLVLGPTGPDGHQYGKRGHTMPVYKGTLLFSNAPLNTQPSGFSESVQFYANTDELARNSLAAWPGERKKVLAHGYVIKGFRLSKSTVVNKSGVCTQTWAPLQIGACVGNNLGLLGDADSPYAAVLFDIVFNEKAKKKRAMLFRGIPDTWWSNQSLNIPAADGTAFLIWFNYMVTQSAGAYEWNVGHAPPCTPTFRFWTTYCSIRIASRRVGRPFGLLRGRRTLGTHA